MKRIVLVVGLVVIAIGALCMFRLSGPTLRFPYATGGVASATPDGFTESRLDGLRVIKRAPKGGETRWLVFFNGNDEHQLTSAAAFLSRVGGDRGLATFAYRGFDGSEGTPSPEALRADAMKFIDSLGVAPASLELSAFSFGAPLSVHVAAELSRRGTPPSKLTLLAATLELSMLQPSRFAPILRGDVYEIGVEDAKAVRCAVSVIHGANDVTLPPSQALAARLGTTMTLLNNVDHGSILKVAELTP